MSIGVVTLGTKNINYYTQYTFPINKAYCERHGYTYIQYNDVIDVDRPPSWSKILALKNHINSFDWLMWIDADAIFYNHDIKIEERVDENYDLIISPACGENWPDAKLPDNANINFGIFLLRGKSDWSVNFLDNLYRRVERLNHRWWETQALSDLYLENNPTINDRIKIIDQYLLNGYENALYGYHSFKHDQYILHWAGMTEKDRGDMSKIRHDEFLRGSFSGDLKEHRAIINVW